MPSVLKIHSPTMGAYHSQANVHERTVSAAFHDLARSPSCNQTSDDPPNQDGEHVRLADRTR
jgi:hypothetical protein